jgi:hypothetical protein
MKLFSPEAVEAQHRFAQRRAFLSRAGVGLGSVAAGTLLQSQLALAAAPQRRGGLPELPHLPPRIKRVIFLCMAGGPSHLETFDDKPKLAELDGQPMPASYTQGQPIAQLQGQELKAQGPLTKFGRYGKSGQTISDFLPWHQKIADEICIVKSMQT